MSASETRINAARSSTTRPPGSIRMVPSRQRVNQELKTMEREGSIRIEQGGLVVLDRAALRRISEAEN